MKKIVITIITLLTLLISPAFADDSYYPRFPFYGNLGVSYSDSEPEQGLLGSGSFYQGITWLGFKKFEFETYLSLNAIWSEHDNDYWNNKYGPILGAKISRWTELDEDVMLGFEVGVQQGYYDFMHSNKSWDNEFTKYISLSLYGDWFNRHDRTFLIGLPFIGYINLSEINGDSDEGTVLAIYTSQGIDWIKIEKWILNTYLGIHYIDSNRDGDYWNNKMGIHYGIKMNHPLDIFGDIWNNLTIGLRGESYRYNSQIISHDDRVLFYVSLSFGGDWKKILLEDN